jgi:hypothetical protein
MTLDDGRLKDAERLIRFAMVVTLCTAGISKFFSHGAFFHYYGELFRNPQLRIHLPSFFVDGFLFLTPYMELAIGLGLLYTPLKRFFTHTWCHYFVTLKFGHCVLEQWPSVNEMIPIILMGAFCLILPEHTSWFYPLTAGLTIPLSAKTVCATVVSVHSHEKVWGARCTESRHFSQITTTIVSE